MLTDEELAALTKFLRIMNDHASESPAPERASRVLSRNAHFALTKLLERERWLASREFRAQLAQTIADSARTVIVQKGWPVGPIADGAREIGNNASQTALFLLEPPMTDEETK